MFSPSTLTLLIYAALALCALGVVVLLALIVRDWKNGNLW